MDKKTIRKLQLAFWNDYDIAAACAYARIPQKDYEQQIEANEDFAHCMTLAQMYPKVKSQTEMVRRIANGDGRLAMKYLERREPEHYDLQYIRKFGRAEDD